MIFALNMMNFELTMMNFISKLIAAVDLAPFCELNKVTFALKHDDFCVTNEELCIKIEEFCVTNEEFCIQIVEFSSRWARIPPCNLPAEEDLRFRGMIILSASVFGFNLRLSSAGAT